MKNWLVVLGALTLVGCSDGEMEKKEEASKTQETEDVVDVQSETIEKESEPTQTPTEEVLSDEEKKYNDTVIGQFQLTKLEGALEEYKVINGYFMDKGTTLGQLEVISMLALVQEEREALMASDFTSLNLNDKEYQSRFEGYREALLLSYEALFNVMKLIPEYNKGTISEESFNFSNEAYTTSVDMVATLRNHLVEYHNNR